MEHSYSCIYCNGNLDGGNYFAKNQKWAYITCQTCQTIQILPFPTAEEFKSAYSDVYYGPGESKFIPLVEKVVHWFRNHRARLVEKNSVKNGTILDIGCGNGEFLEECQRKGFNCYGVELAGKQAQRARRILGAKLQTTELKTHDFDKEQFDVVTLWHVYEHLTTPKQTLKIITEIIKPGGTLFLSLPNIASWQAMLFRGNWFHLDPPRHIFFQTTQTITRELEQMGYEIQRVTYLSFEQNLFGYMQSFLNVLSKHYNFFYHCLQGVGWKKRKVLFLSHGLLLTLFLPVFIGATLCEAAFQKGGTFLIQCLKK